MLIAGHGPIDYEFDTLVIRRSKLPTCGQPSCRMRASFGRGLCAH